MIDLRAQAGAAFGVAVSQDGKTIASCHADKLVKIWDLAGALDIQTLTGPGSPVLDVIYSPDGQRIAASSADKTVRIWDAHIGQEIMRLDGHEKSIFRVAYSP